MFSGVIPWIVLVSIVVFWIPQNAQHEGAHALMAKRFGAAITSFKPYPNWANGYFAFASMSWEGGEYDDRGRAQISIAPQVANSLILCSLVLLREFVPMSSTVASIVAAWALVNYIDGMWNLGTFYKPEPAEEDKHTDGWSFQRHTGLNKWTCRVGASIWHVSFAGALLFVG